MNDIEFSQKGFEMSEVLRKRYHGMIMYCTMQKEGSVKKLKGLFCGTYYVSERTARDYVSMLRSWNIINITGDKWSYTGSKEIYDQVKLLKQYENM